MLVSCAGVGVGETGADDPPPPPPQEDTTNSADVAKNSPTNLVQKEVTVIVLPHQDYGRGSPAVLGSFGESSMASRRKRGPVAFRPSLSAGLALSVLLVTEL